MSAFPGNWLEVSLGDLGDWRGGGTPSKSNSKFWTDGEIPWVSPKDMKRPVIDDAQDHITEQAIEASATQLIPKGSVLLVTRSGILQHTLPVAVNSRHVTINQDLKALTPTAGVDASFIAAQLISRAADILRTCAKSGTTVDSIDFERLKAYVIGLPPGPEQRRIVAKLDGLRVRSSRARQELDHIPNLIERYKQAILAKAFSGELTKEWQVHQPPRSADAILESVLEERETLRAAHGVRSKGRNRSIPQKASNLPLLPPTWTWLTFDDCSWDLTVGHVGPMKDRYVQSGIPFLRSFNIKPNQIDSKGVAFIDETFDRELRKSKLSTGSIVVVRTGEPGTAAVVPHELDGANCSDLVICRPVPSLNPYFASHYINSAFAKRLVRDVQVGVAQQHFNVGAMSQLVVPYPPAEEQFEIVRRIDHAFAWLSRIATEHARADNLLPKLDQAILAKAFRGELVPQDPNDEPASVLLERIKAEGVGTNQSKRRRALA